MIHVLAIAHHAAGMRFTSGDARLLIGVLIGFVSCFAIEHRK